MKGDRIFIVIPAFNESPEVVDDTLKKVLQKKYEVVLVDDGSSRDVMTRSHRHAVHYLRHSINLGQGASLQTGMDYALQNGADIIVHFDADGQQNVDDIGKFISRLQADNLDVVLGSRFLKAEDSAAVPKGRRLVLRLARLVNGIFTGLWLTDAHNGFRVFNRSGAMKIRLTENRMAHASEILRLIKKNGLRYCEVPTHIVYTEYSKAKGQTAINSFNILIDLIKNRIL